MTSEPRDPPQFYLTSPAPCPYLPGKEERKVFTHLVGRRAARLNDALTHSGFRRSQTIAYRPACENCRACVSVRILATEFSPGRTRRSFSHATSDLIGELGPARADERAVPAVSRLSRLPATATAAWPTWPCSITA